MASHRSLCGCLRSAPEPQMDSYKSFVAWNNAHDDWMVTWARTVRIHEQKASLKRPRAEAMAQPQARQPQAPVRSIADLYE